LPVAPEIRAEVATLATARPAAIAVMPGGAECSNRITQITGGKLTEEIPTTRNLSKHQIKSRCRDPSTWKFSILVHQKSCGN